MNVFVEILQFFVDLIGQVVAEILMVLTGEMDITELSVAYILIPIGLLFAWWLRRWYKTKIMIERAIARSNAHSEILRNPLLVPIQPQPESSGFLAGLIAASVVFVLIGLVVLFAVSGYLL